MRPGLSLSGNLLLEMRRGRTVRPWKLSAPCEDSGVLYAIFLKSPTMCGRHGSSDGPDSSPLPCSEVPCSEGGRSLPSFASVRGPRPPSASFEVTSRWPPTLNTGRGAWEEWKASGYKASCTVDPVCTGEAE